MYDALRQLSDGRISSASHSEYEIDRIEVFSEYPDPKMAREVTLRSASFFFPPLGGVKTQTECPYQAGYVLKRGDQTIRTNLLSGVIKDDFQGWYVAGTLQGKHLLEDLSATAEREVAVQLINDVYATLGNQP